MTEFPHVMLREIYEQPEAIRRTLDLYSILATLKEEAFAPFAGWLESAGRSTDCRQRNQPPRGTRCRSHA